MSESHDTMEEHGLDSYQVRHEGAKTRVVVSRDGKRGEAVGEGEGVAALAAIENLDKDPGDGAPLENKENPATGAMPVTPADPAGIAMDGGAAEDQPAEVIVPQRGKEKRAD